VAGASEGHGEPGDAVSSAAVVDLRAAASVGTVSTCAHRGTVRRRATSAASSTTFQHVDGVTHRADPR